MSCWVFSPNTFKPSVSHWLPCLNSGQSYSRQTGENPPYKGGWWKIGYHQEGRDEPDYPKPRINSQVAPSLLSTIEWGSRGSPPNVNLLPRVVLDTQVWLPAKDGDGRSHSYVEGIMLNSRGERMTKTLEVTEAEQLTPGIVRVGETRGKSWDTHHTTWILHG